MKVIKPNNLPTGISTADDRLTRSTGGGFIDVNGSFQTTTSNTARFTYSKASTSGTPLYEGLLFEPTRTNGFLNSTTLSTQTVALVNGTTYTVSFYGTGSLTFASQTLSGTGANTRVSRTFTATGSTTFTVSGTVQYAQVETGSFATSWISTADSTASRTLDDLTSALGVAATSVTDTVALWSISTTYALGDIVRRFGRKYQSLQNSNTGNGPVSSPTWWLDIGPDNVYACLDKQVSTSTTMTSVSFIQYGIRALVTERSNGVGVLGVVGGSDAMYPITVRVAIYNTLTGARSTASKVLSTSSDQNAVFSDMTTAGDIISVRIDASSTGTLSVSTIATGPMTDLGTTQYGANAGIIDYSKKETNEFGTTTFVERAYSKRMSAQVLVPNANLNAVQRFLYSLRATPAVWIGSDDSTYDEALTVYGFYRDFSTDIAYPAHSICNLEIEGLI